MGIMTKTCGAVTALVAMNWVAMGLFQADAVGRLMGGRRTPATDGLHVVVALAALYFLVSLVRKRSKG